MNKAAHCLQCNESFSHTIVSKGALEIHMETSGYNTICRQPAPEHNEILSLRGSKIGINSICHSDNSDFD